MKTILLCGLNARYSHSCLALLYLKAVAPEHDVRIAEYNINDSIPDVIEGVVTAHPDAVGFSCYIWNISHVLKTAAAVKKLLPDCFVFFGGPEVSFDAEDMMHRYPFIDMIIRGAGEAPFSHFADAFCAGLSVAETPSACIRSGGAVVCTEDAAPVPLCSLPFVYSDLSPFENRIIYYETSRGCPFRCAYCLSAETSLQYLLAERVAAELEFFMRANVQQVKLVDRTFNHPDSRARDIFSALIALSHKYPQSRTNFHFEISASLLSEQTLAVLSKAPPGLLQFEVGIQSTHAETLDAVSRTHDIRQLLVNAAALCRMENIQTYVDLIAGLPFETAESFAVSFNDAYQLGAAQLQLGFLKLLKGAPMRAQASRHGIAYTDEAPYEVLYTRTMSYDTLRRIHRIEKVLDALYNSFLARRTLAYLVPMWPSAFSFFDGFTGYLTENGYFDRPHKQKQLLEHLHAYAAVKPGIRTAVLREALAFDWLCTQKPAVWPIGCEMVSTDEENIKIRRFFTDAAAIARYLPAYQALSRRDMERHCRIYFFHHLFGANTSVLFDYGRKPQETGFWQMLSL